MIKSCAVTGNNRCARRQMEQAACALEEGGGTLSGRQRNRTLRLARRCRRYGAGASWL